jgi:hypothetical protein
MVCGLCPNHGNVERHIQREPFAHAARSLTHVTQQKMGSPTLVLITHFAAKIMLIAFLNPGCEDNLQDLNDTSLQM